MKKLKTFFATGSCSAKEIEIIGSVKEGVFKSDFITGKLEQSFYDKLALKAKETNSFIYLKY